MPRPDRRPSPRMVGRARQLRRAMSFPERLLWSRPRQGRCCGLHFRRQEPIGGYVADFFCSEAAVVVELDGRSHDQTPTEDMQRQAHLESMGLTVVRFTNDRVLRDLDGVVEAIAWACGKMD